MTRKSTFFALVLAVVLMVCTLFGIKPVLAGAGPAMNETRVILHGNVNPRAKPRFDQGPSDPSLPMNRMILLLKTEPGKQAQLDRLVREQQDPSSSNFHKWLSPDEFGRRFGQSPAQMAIVKNWLLACGFTIDSVSKSGTMINFSGTAAQVDRAFEAHMHDYRVNGHLRHANSVDPSIPSELADLVVGPVSLTNFPHKPTHSKGLPLSVGGAIPAYTEGGSYSLSPGDFAAIYDLNPIYNSMGYNGQGETIAIVGQAPANTSAWATFRSTFGLPPNAPNVMVAGPNTPYDEGGGDGEESDLDVEWAGAVAPGATIDFVTAAINDGGIDTSAQYVVDNKLAPIMSVSYQFCEPENTSEDSFYSGLWEQAAAEGITVFVASGDYGAYACSDINSPTVNGLASTPYNVAVGGTSLSSSPQYWSSTNKANGVSVLTSIPTLPEVAWNSDDGSASGGGASSIYPKPAWQVSPGVPSDNRRYIPDVSLNSDPNSVGYRVYTCDDSAGPCAPGSNGFYLFGGTSCASPAFAGIMALVEQSLGGQSQGNANTIFYQLGNAQYGTASSSATVFNDITSGNNGYGTSLPGFSCTSGFDPVTGLGSVYATALLAALNPSEAAVCGASNGQGFFKVPTANLCQVGKASRISGRGPWSWTCAGLGGATVSCSANLEVNGLCGTSNGKPFLAVPTANLCRAGSPSATTGSGPWYWSCAGTYGGANASCSAKLKINGTCGSANKADFFTQPTVNLCNSGNASSTTGKGPWRWTCAGSNGGTSARCSANLEVNGTCGSAGGQSFPRAPRSNLCGTGKPSRLTGTGPWSWTCAGSNGGVTANCSANILVNGVCGTANGKIYSSAPTANLCKYGIASQVSGTGPWDWTCQGENGGTSTSCSASGSNN